MMIVVRRWNQLTECTRITDEQEFKNILMDCEEPGQVEDQWNSYGQEFLVALRHP